MPSVTIYTRNPQTGQLADTPDLVVVLRSAGVDTPVTPTHEGTGEYVVTFDEPMEFAELIASSAANSDASVVYRAADVAGGGGGTIDADEVATAVAALLTDRTLTIASPLLANGTIEIVAGDAYVDDRAIVVTLSPYTGEAIDTLTLKLMPRDLYQTPGDDTAATLTVTGTATTDGTDLTATFELTALQTATLTPARNGNGRTAYTAQIIDADNDVTLWSGKADVVRRLT